MGHKYVLTSILVLLLLIGCSKKDTNQLILEADEYILSNDNNAAVITLKQAIASDQRNQELRFKLGELYLNMGLFAQAEKELRRSSDLGAAEDLITPLLVKTFYYQELLDQVIVSAQSFKTENKQAQSAVELYAYIAQLKTANQANLDKELFTKKNLLGDDLLLAKAYDAYVNNQPGKALEMLSERTSQQDKLEALLLSGILHAYGENYQDSIKSYEEALELAPYNYMIKYQIAEVHIKNNQLNNAEKYVDELLEIYNEGAYANLLKAQIAFRRDQYDTAFSSASIAVQKGLDRPLANLIAGISAYKLDNFESAFQYLTKISKQLPPNHHANHVLVEVRLKLGELNNINELLESFTDNSANTSAVYALAAMTKFQQGNISEAIQFFERSNTINPNNALNLMREGLAKISMADYQGINSLKEATRLDSTLDQGWALLAQAYMQNNDPDSAFKTVKQWQEINKIDGLNLEAYLYLQLGKNKEARAILEPLIESNPEHFSAVRFLMLLNAREKKFDEAKPLAERLLRLDSTNLQTYYTLLNISLAEGKAKEVESQLITLLNDKPSEKESMALKIALGKLYNYQNRPNLTTKLGWDLNVIYDDDALIVLGEAYQILKDYSSAYRVYNHWLGQRTTNKYPWLKLLEVLDNAREYELGLQAASKAIQIFKDDIAIKGLLAKFNVKNGQITAGKELIADISLRSPNAPLLDLLNGEIALRAEDLQQAEIKLTRFYKTYPSINSASLLAETLIRQSKVDEAINYLDSELEREAYKSIPDIHYVAELYTDFSLYENAAKHYETLMQLNETEVVTLNNYASLLIKLGQFEKALQIANKALRLMPKSPYILDTVGWAAFKNGQTKESLSYAANAFELLPDHTEIQLHLIEILIANGQMQEAKSLISQCKPTKSSEVAQLALLKTML